jgi:spore cortex biosynthesis protein YabQ
MSLSMQYLTVLAMSASGAVLGAVYDVYRTILAEWKYLRWLGSILDFVFWIFALLWVLWSLHWANGVDVRFYIFLILLIGYGLYRLLLRRLVVGSTVRVVLAINFGLRMIWRLFMLVVVGPLVWLWGLAMALLRLINRIAALLEKAILWPFAPFLRFLEWAGRLLYGWTIEPLVEPVLKPVRQKMQEWIVNPCRNFVAKTRRKWKGFLKRVANWLVNHEDDDKPKR